jgi:hypothetical protein
MVQAVAFTSAAIRFDDMKWQDVLSRFGYVCFYSVTEDDQSGYALYQSREAAITAAENLHETSYPPGSDNEIRFELCDLEELELLVQLAVREMNSVRVSEPESGAVLFHVTQTQPPIYWTPRGETDNYPLKTDDTGR